MKTLLSFLLLLSLFSSCGVETEELPGSRSTQLIETRDYQIKLDFLYEVRESEDGMDGEIIFLSSAMQQVKDKCSFEIWPGELPFELKLPLFEDEQLGMVFIDGGGQFGFRSESGNEKTIHQRWKRETEEFITIFDLRDPRFGKVEFTCKSI